MWHAFGLALFLLLSGSLLQTSRSGPLDEAAPLLACPACGPVVAAATTPGGIVAVGERGLILHGTSGGNWQQMPAPVRRTLTSVTRTAVGSLVAAGHDALLLSWADARSAWTIVRSSPELDAPLLDIWISDNGKGFAVGAYGLMLTTDNHGQDWTRRMVDPDEPHFYSVHESDNGAVFLAGEFGVLFRSRDGGASWTRLDTGWEGTFFGIRAGVEGRLLLFGLEGVLMESHDDGGTWRHLDSGVTSALYDAVFLPDGRATAVGEGGTFLIESAQGGFVRVARDSRKAISAVLVDRGGTVFLFGEEGIDLMSLQTVGPKRAEGRW